MKASICPKLVARSSKREFVPRFFVSIWNNWGLLTGLFVLLPLFSSCQKEKQESPPDERRASKWEKAEDGKNSVEILHPQVKSLLDQCSKGNDFYNDIRETLYSLPKELSRADACALEKVFLATPSPQWSELCWAAVVNDGLNVLRNLNTSPPHFADNLMSCCRDSSRPSVIRDYALQHLGVLLIDWYGASSGKSVLSASNSQERTRMIQFLSEFMSPQSGALAGTACNAVDDIIMVCERKGIEAPFCLQALFENCKVLFSDNAQSVHARISALGILARHATPQARVEALSVMTDERHPVLLRAAAVHYIAVLSDERDVSLLHEFVLNKDHRLSAPARKILSNSLYSGK